MRMNEFIKKGYEVREFIEVVNEYNNDLEDLVDVELDDLEPMDFSGSVVETHFSDEESWYTIINSDGNTVADHLDFDGLIEAINSL